MIKVSLFLGPDQLSKNAVLRTGSLPPGGAPLFLHPFLLYPSSEYRGLPDKLKWLTLKVRAICGWAVLSSDSQKAKNWENSELVMHLAKTWWSLSYMSLIYYLIEKGQSTGPLH